MPLRVMPLMLSLEVKKFSAKSTWLLTSFWQDISLPRAAHLPLYPLVAFYHQFNRKLHRWSPPFCSLFLTHVNCPLFSSSSRIQKVLRGLFHGLEIMIEGHLNVQKFLHMFHSFYFRVHQHACRKFVPHENFPLYGICSSNYRAVATQVVSLF